MQTGLRGKTAIVTGAGGGIGLEICKALLGEGAVVLGIDIDPAAGDRMATALGPTGAPESASANRWQFLAADVTDEALWIGVFAHAESCLGPVSVLVNNAGVIRTTSLEDVSLADWRREVAINLDGVFLATREAIKSMKARGGSIINIASVAAMAGIYTAAPYCAAKGGVRAFTKAAALHCAHHKYDIRVNSVHPGYIETPMTGKLIEDARNPDKVKAAFAAAHPVGRMGTPADIAAGVLYLAGDLSRFVTGSELVIDGGYLAQ